ncbi:hypothetical protein [Lentzea albidocapillata]|uniref:hypothetical protein n=1 Tax=Lentzea albidocapillata TaxID=40571 RepID=UPI001183A04C|nr:hypothetical protein [Lentzea albidocapillata]
MALAAVSCSPGSGDQQAAPQQKHFDVTGWGKLKPGMSKKDALATGDLAATAAGKTGDCEDYRYQDAPAPDPKQLAADAEIEQKYEAAQKVADDADAGAKAVELSAESTKRIAARAEAREANGGVMFAGDKIRMIVPPPGVTAAKNVGKGATVDQFKAAYPNAVDKDGKGFEVPVPDQQGVVLSFHFTDGKLTTFLLFNGETKCALN